MATFQHVKVHGAPIERGRQYGEQAREKIKRSLSAYAQVFWRYAGWDWATVQKQAQRYEDPIRNFDPILMEEIEGIARGSAIDVVDILALNVRTEIMFAARAREAMHATKVPRECSSFAILPDASSNGHAIIGQNWDWLVFAFDTIIVLEAQTDEGPDYVTVVEAGLLAKMGFNSAGIGLVTNALVTDDDAGVPGVPFHAILRAILSCESISDALGTIQRSVRSSSANYLIAHRDGLALSVESMPGDFSRVRLVSPDRDLLFHTNHYVSQSFDRKDVTLWLAPDSPFRLERLRSLLLSSHPHLTVEHLQNALRDHVNHPHGVCTHPDPGVDEADREASVTSVIMDLNARKMWVADGLPCSVPYRELDYSRFLGKRLSALEAPSPQRGRSGESLLAPAATTTRPAAQND